MTQLLARILGVILTLFGITGFFLPANGTIHELLHLTLPHNLIHLISGIIFLAVSNRENWSRLAAQIFGVIYGIVAIFGLFLHNIFGLIESTGTIEVIHFIIAIAALYVGFRDISRSAKKGKNKQTESTHS
jgi:uncharacterized membrane protein HdeD (DUF308 family)